MENEITNDSQKMSDEITESNIRTCVGITGNSGNNDLAMAKFWVSNGVVEKAEIHTIGSDYILSRAVNLQQQLTGKTLNEVEMYMDYSVSTSKREHSEYDPINEAIMRALDDYHMPDEKPKGEDLTPEQPEAANVPESNDEQIPANQDIDSGEQAIESNQPTSDTESG